MRRQLISPEDFLETAIIPGIRLCGDPMDTPDAAVFLLDVAQQETGLVAMTQIGAAEPAMGPYQFEKGEQAMCALVLKKFQWVRDIVAASFGHDPDDHEAVRLACRDDWVLATVIARAGAYASKHAMPRMTDPAAMWEFYLDVWGPGKPKPATWHPYHQRSIAAWKARGLKPITESRTMLAGGAGATISLGTITLALINFLDGHDIEPEWALAAGVMFLCLFVGVGYFRLDDRLAGKV